VWVSRTGRVRIWRWIGSGKEIPADIPVVSETGIKNHDDMQRLADHGVAAALIGETLMRAADQSAALKELRGAL